MNKDIPGGAVNEPVAGRMQGQRVAGSRGFRGRDADLTAAARVDSREIRRLSSIRRCGIMIDEVRR